MEEFENNTIDLIQYLYTVLKKRGIWFTQKQDPTWEEPKSYYKLDEYGDLTETSAKQVEKEIENLIGDGAIDLVDAVGKWVDMNLCEYKIAYKETLVTQFKQKEVVDGIGAVECRHQLAENNKLQEDEYDDYMKNERKLAEQYKARVKADISDKARKHFDMLKDIIDGGEDKVNVDGWYYPEKAVYVVKNSDLSYHLNKYMDLNVANILNMVRDNDTIEDAIDELFEDYKADSAYSWADNFITKLDGLDFSVLDDLVDYNEDDYEEIDESRHIEKVTEALSMESIYDLINSAKNPFQISGAVHSMSYVDGGVANILQDQLKSMKNNGTEFNDIKDKLLDTISANMVEDDKEKMIASKEVKLESVKSRLKEENTKSQNVISDMITSPNFDSDSNQGKIVLRTSELFNALSSKGYDVQTTFDNGESQNTILLGQQGGIINITITNDNQPLRAFTSGSFEINDENLKILTDIQNEIKVL